MARKIKFRAWLQGKHDSINFGFDGFMDHDVTIQNGQWCSVESGWDIQGQYKSIPLMQYTGLTDKNGKEIYEGDIVDYPNNGVNEVKFEKGCYWLNGHILGHLNQQHLEVVGNIHENPELLECK